MKRYGYTQVALAEKMGITRQSLDESLKSNISTGQLERIAEAIGCSVPEFYGIVPNACNCPYCGHRIEVVVSLK